MSAPETRFPSILRSVVQPDSVPKNNKSTNILQRTAGEVSEALPGLGVGGEAFVLPGGFAQGLQHRLRTSLPLKVLEDFLRRHGNPYGHGSNSRTHSETLPSVLTHSRLTPMCLCAGAHVRANVCFEGGFQFLLGSGTKRNATICGVLFQSTPRLALDPVPTPLRMLEEGQYVLMGESMAYCEMASTPKPPEPCSLGHAATVEPLEGIHLGFASACWKACVRGRWV